MNRRRALVVSAIAAAVVALGLPAWAFFTSTTTTVSPTVSAASVNSPGTVSVTTINGTANLSWSTPTTPSGATFSYTVARTAGGGSAGGTCGTSLTATSCQDSGLTPGTSYTWTVTPHLGNNWNGTTSQATTTAAGPLSAFVVTLPGTATAGTAVDMTVTAKDAGGNTVTGYTGTPSFTSTDGQASLPSGYAFVAADAGSHTYTGGVTLKTAGSQTVTAKDGTPAGTSAGTTVSAAAANKLAFTTSPAGASAGSPFATQPVVQVQDQFGNLTSSGATISLAIGTNPSGGTLSGCSGLTASGGVVTVSGCQISAAGNGYTLTASSAGLNAGTSSIFNVSPAAAITISESNTKKSSNGNSTSDTVTITSGTNFGANATLIASVSGGTGGSVTTQISGSVHTDASGNIPANTTFVMSNPIGANVVVTVTITDSTGKSATATFTTTN